MTARMRHFIVGRAWRIAAAGFGAALVAALTLTTPSIASASNAPGWTGVTAPNPADAQALQSAYSSAVACPAPGLCYSAGEYLAGGAYKLEIDSLSGGTWTSTAAPMPPNDKAGDEPFFNAMSCPTVTWCLAWGQYTDSADHGQLFATTLSGGSWTTTVLPQPPGSASIGYEVSGNLALSCPTAGNCVAVGGYALDGDHASSFIDTLASGSWTSLETPVPAGAGADPEPELGAVACATPTACVAGGVYKAATYAGLLVTLSGTSWHAVAAPLPADAAPTPYPEINGVSCPAAGACVAVGYYAGTHEENLIEQQHGTTWSPLAGPEPADAAPGGAASAGLNDVDCPSSSWCTAVGSYTNTSGTTYSPEIDTLAGGKWTSQPGPGLVAADTEGNLSAVSCSWPGSCTASGRVDTKNGTVAHPLIDTLTDGTWSGNDTVLPPDADPTGQGFPTAPACVAGFCLVGGSYTTHTPDTRGFLDVFPNLAGYQEIAADGGVFAFGTPYYGSMGGKPLNSPIVGSAVVPDSGGYYEVASDGGIFAFHAPFYGSMGGKPLNKPIVGIAFDTLTGGYYEVASDGGIFAFNAPFYGSMGGKPLNKPIVGIAFDAATGGYYEVASDGGIFAFHAPFLGSTGGSPLVAPVVGLTVDPTTGGYYEVASDGGLFAYGAPFKGSMGGKPLVASVVGMAYDYVTGGYYEMASDGGIFAFGAPFKGSMGGKPLNAPQVSIGFG